jgi:hypothetical protein
MKWQRAPSGRPNTGRDDRTQPASVHHHRQVPETPTQASTHGRAPHRVLTRVLLNNLVGSRQQSFGDGEVERLGRLEVSSDDARQHAGEWGALICAGHHLETFPDAPIKKQSDIRFATPGAIASRQRPRPVGESKGLRRSSWQAGRAAVTDLGERNATDRPADRITAAMDPFNQDPVVR